ncbi:11138_t:CDS:2, partial [Gigaspora rosea]
VENRPRERQVFPDRLLIRFIGNMSKMNCDNDAEGVSEIMDDLHVYDDGKNILGIDSQICH